MQKTSLSKDKIFHAAIALFNSKGYAETSIREIAALADANVSTISYYYNGKQGLLEHCFITFFEPYIQIMENVLKQSDFLSAEKCITNMIEQLMNYQYKHSNLARFIWREISLEKQIVREVMSTYFMKERYIFQKIIDKGVRNKEFKTVPVGFTIIQLKSQMMMPFLNNLYSSEVWQVYFHEQFYFERYKKQILQWLHSYLIKK